MLDLSNKPQGSFNIIDQLIKLNSFLLTFFIFFGIRIPFQASNYSLDYTVEITNVYNQVLYLFLFFSSLVVLINRYDKMLSFIRAERYLSLFVLLCLVSALWSDYPFLSIKRSFQLLVMFIVVTEALINIEPDILLKQLKIVVSLYLFYNLYACRFIPAAIDPVFGTWRGIEVQKNLLANSTLYCLLSSIVFFIFERTKLTKIYNLVLMLIAVIIIYKAGSSTIIIAVVIIVFLGFLLKIETFFSKLNIGRSFLGFIVLIILSVSVIFLILSSEVFSSIPGFFGKDSSLSMRIPIWEYVWTEIEKNLLLGYGFSTYWIMGHSRIDIFASLFDGFKVNEAHNGYIEIMLQLGVVGFIFFLFPIIAYIHRMLKLNSNVAMLLLLSMLTLNITESVLFKIGMMGQTTFFFLGSYIAISVFHFNLGNVNHDEENH